jgi:transcriptional regulator with XRE-family HTH domain
MRNSGLDHRKRRSTARRPDARDASIASRVRGRRIECGLSQAAIGDQLGVSLQQVQKYEKGTNRIGSGRLQQIARILRVPVSAFFDRTGAAQPDSGSVLRSRPSLELMRLLKAFSRIQSRGAHRLLVALAEELALR